MDLHVEHSREFSKNQKITRWEIEVDSKKSIALYNMYSKRITVRFVHILYIVYSCQNQHLQALFCLAFFSRNFKHCTSCIATVHNVQIWKLILGQPVFIPPYSEACYQVYDMYSTYTECTLFYQSFLAVQNVHVLYKKYSYILFTQKFIKLSTTSSPLSFLYIVYCI